jgi:S1-C subfamily serine protease
MYSDSIYVTLNDGNKYKAEIIGQDYRNDIAVLKIPITISNSLLFSPRYLEFPSFECNWMHDCNDINHIDVNIGDQVFALGFPDILLAPARGVNPIIFSEGTISNLNYLFSTPDVGNHQVMVIDNKIFHGNSGGALLDKYGRLIGITEGGDEERSGFNWAIPYNIVIQSILNILANHDKGAKCAIAPASETDPSHFTHTFNQYCSNNYKPVESTGMWQPIGSGQISKTSQLVNQNIYPDVPKSNTAPTGGNGKPNNNNPVCGIISILKIPC